MSGGESITILIPTKNRAGFLSRLLNYFAEVRYQHWIYIGDSSNQEQTEKIKLTIQNVEDKLKIKHLDCTGLSGVQATEHMTESVTTPYCVLIPDDDFLCPNGLDKCTDFLDSNPNYTAAYGVGINTKIDGTGPHGNISWVHYYEHPPLDSESGSQRVSDFFAAGTYALVHDVHRTEEWQEIVRGFISRPWARQQFHFDGLTPGVVSAIRNRAKKLDCLYLVRVGHSGIYFNVDEYDWLTNKDWHAGFSYLHDRAVEELIKIDNISNEEAEKVFKDAFWPFIAWMISRGQRTLPHGKLHQVRTTVGNIPGVRKIYLNTIYRLFAKEQINLLPSLLSPDYPFHDDFMPVYSAIKNQRLTGK
jgi:glycosyltransferase domain-containing protein